MNSPAINPRVTDFLKLLACVSMLIDHIGAILGPYLFAGETVLMLRAIGRFAFPIFAYHIALGIVNTRNVRRYFLRLLIFALISQYPFALAFGTGLNVVVTLLLGLCAIWLFERVRGSGAYDSSAFGGIGFLGVALAALIAQALDCDYGAFGVITVFLFYYFKDKPSMCAAAQFIAVAAYIFLSGSPPVKWFALAGYVLIFVRMYGLNYPRVTADKYFFYVFYPAHLLILSLIRDILL